MNTWKSWLKSNRAILVESPIPSFVYSDHRTWSYFSLHGATPRALGPPFDVRTLSPVESAKLLQALDTAPETSTVLRAELLLNLTRTDPVVLEVLVVSRDGEPLSDSALRAAALALGSVEAAFDRLIIDRAAQLTIAAGPRGSLLTFSSATLHPLDALGWARRIAENAVGADGHRLTPLSWPARFDDEMLV